MSKKHNAGNIRHGRFQETLSFTETYTNKHTYCGGISNTIQQVYLYIYTTEDSCVYFHRGDIP